MNRDAIRQKVLGCLIGGLIGDAMGAPVEGWRYERIIAEKGYISDFEGGGTDDSIIKLILCEALLENGGHATADDFAESFLRHADDYKWFFVPVRNMFHKIQDGHALPVDAGRDNTASSSSAMSVAPIGIVNACDPRTAAAEAYETSGLIHSGSCAFCRDGASAVAAAVAEAFKTDATVESVMAASTAFLHRKSAEIMRGRIGAALEMARNANGYEHFRKRYYETERLFNTISDSRETVPVALSAFYLSGGDANLAVEYGANFGRDADTIATMAGAVAGAFAGVDGFKRSWTDKVLTANNRQDKLADDMTGLVLRRYEERTRVQASIDAI
jgi:ADP-ribosylglycohydrolase